MTDSDPRKDLVRSFVQAINEHAWASLKGMVRADFVRHQAGSGTSIHGRESLVEFLMNELQTFPDATEKVQELVAEGDRVAAHLTFRGTQRGPLGPYPATGKRIEADFSCFFRLADGQIAEAWVVWDGLDMLRQLGHEV